MSDSLGFEIRLCLHGDGCGATLGAAHDDSCRLIKAEAEVVALTGALYKCYQFSGADAGDEDDFRALVNKCEAVPLAVKELRGLYETQCNLSLRAIMDLRKELK